MMPRTRQVPSPAASSSQVLQVPDDQSAIRISGTLRLRGDDSNSSGINTGSAPNRHIRWGQDVVDNEGMGKKSSKVCCIYHKPRPVGESSSESESSDSDSDSDSDSEANRHQNRPNRSQHHLDHRESSHHQHSSQEDSEKGHAACCTKHHGKQGKQRKPSPNAYERMPKPPKGHYKSQGA